jgi:hypothetical protein
MTLRLALEGSACQGLVRHEFYVFVWDAHGLQCCSCSCLTKYVLLDDPLSGVVSVTTYLSESLAIVPYNGIYRRQS